ncbi:MAG TPA: DNA glycosylase [Chthoniobacteraceae bacterium]|nr:DNA glycosylase [Chthoniobacteraceae bacterium]
MRCEPGAAQLTAIDAPQFDLELTLTCGQVFHWVRHENGWLGAMGDLPVFVQQRGHTLFATPGHAARIAEYFALDHPLETICSTFPKDAGMSAAADFCRGLRIIRQPAWECLATFITSSMKRVAHIAQISHDLRRRFGAPVRCGDVSLFAYPEAERIAALDEQTLRECRLGYRAKHLLRSAQMIAHRDVDLGALAAASDEDARAELCRLPGVGEKIANCVLLFGFGRLRAFPIDVWIERVLRTLYFRGKRNVTPQRLRTFSHDYFGPFGGYAQQYLFHHARMLFPRKPSSRGSQRRVRRSPTRPVKRVRRLESISA